MKKYLSVFKISFQQEFVYRLNFIMWRVRNVLQIFLIFFLWNAVFSQPGAVVFGYDRAKILTYVFGILVVRALVFSARAVDVAGEIANGDIVNILLKPIGFFKYWLTRDLSSKALNLSFASVETGILFLLLKPQIFIQTNPIYMVGFFVSVIVALLIYFVLLMMTSFVPLWFPEAGWGAQFLLIVVAVEFLSGGLFPLDILPMAIQKVLYMTPFPYLIFFPIEVYLGKLAPMVLLGGITISISWLILLLLAMRWLWHKGLLAYKAEGR